MSQVAANKGPTELVSELLVGFDPLPPLIEALEQRFGNLAVFGADFHGGRGGVVGLKWLPAAFLPAPVKVLYLSQPFDCMASFFSEECLISAITERMTGRYSPSPFFLT